MKTEYEIKFTPIVYADLVQQLATMGAQCVKPRTLMRRMNYDGSVKNGYTGRSFVRIRDEGDKVTCTYKQVSPDLDIHAVKEIECMVDSFDALKSIFAAIGYFPRNYQESYREKRILPTESGDVEFCIDERPGLVPFVEIEGPSEAIVRHYAQVLGYDRTQGFFGTVNEIYRTSLGIDNKVFDEMPEVTFAHPPTKQ